MPLPITLIVLVHSFDLNMDSCFLSKQPIFFSSILWALSSHSVQCNVPNIFIVSVIKLTDCQRIKASILLMKISVKLIVDWLSPGEIIT